MHMKVEPRPGDVGVGACRKGRQDIPDAILQLQFKPAMMPDTSYGLRGLQAACRWFKVAYGSTAVIHPALLLGKPMVVLHCGSLVRQTQYIAQTVGTAEQAV